jgi:preprotein translocase subunit SecE
VTELHDSSSAASEREAPRRPAKGERGSLPARVSLYIRQVIAELRKVIWPTRKELSNYTTVVIAFVLVMIALLSVLDYAFGRLMFWVFS